MLPAGDHGRASAPTRSRGAATWAECRGVLGDAVMLISADPGHLLQTTLTLVDEVSKLEGSPAIRAGLAHGEARGIVKTCGSACHATC